MKEYALEKKYFCDPEREEVDLKQLEADLLSREDYKKAHEHLVIACHDVLINYREKALLVRRNNYPAWGEYWPVGGRIYRGMSTEDSLRRKVKEEVNLDLTEITFLGVNRTFFETEPFRHGHGTDTLNLMYFAKGYGDLKLDDWHSFHLRIPPEEYSQTYRKSLHPYVREIMELALPHFKLEKPEDNYFL